MITCSWEDCTWKGAELFCIKKRQSRRGIRSLESNKLFRESRSGDCSCVVRPRKSETLRNRSVQDEWKEHPFYSACRRIITGVQKRVRCVYGYWNLQKHLKKKRNAIFHFLFEQSLTAKRIGQSLSWTRECFLSWWFLHFPPSPSVSL